MRCLGRSSDADARSLPLKYLITRAVGVDATVDGDLFEQTLADGDILLLCSDGLTGMVEDGKIAEVLAGAGTLSFGRGRLRYTGGNRKIPYFFRKIHKIFKKDWKSGRGL